MKDKINSKTISRIAAVQVLYQYDSGSDPSILIQKVLDLYKERLSSEDFGVAEERIFRARPSLSHLVALVENCVSNLVHIDSVIEKYLPDNENKLSPLPLAILRLGATELFYLPNVPPKVTVNEFTDIASEMLSEAEIGFVNSILDKISKSF